MTMEVGELYRAVEILLVEDNPGDARLTMEALKENHVANFRTMSHVDNGEKAIAYLQKEPPYEDRATPDIVLLDIDLPKVNGLEVLTFIRSHPSLGALPVVMLTSSTREKDVVEAYGLHVNAYVAKPVDFGQFLEAIKRFDEFWLTVVRLPPKLET